MWASSAGVIFDLPILIPTGIRGQRPEAWSPSKREATASHPSLLNPKRLISACWWGYRKRRGLGLPGCGRAVTVPISANPNPSASQAGRARAFLSIPAARPTGLGKVMPATVRGRGGTAFPAVNLMRFGQCDPASSIASTASCASSGSSEKKIGRSSRV